MRIELCGPSGVGKSALMQWIDTAGFKCLTPTKAEEKGCSVIKKSGEDLLTMEKHEEFLALTEFLDYVQSIVAHGTMSTLRKWRCSIILRNTWQAFIKVRMAETLGTPIIHDELFVHRAASVLPAARHAFWAKRKYFNLVPTPDAVIFCKASPETILARVNSRGKPVNCYYEKAEEEKLQIIEQVLAMNRFAADILQSRGTRVFTIDMNDTLEASQRQLEHILSELGIKRSKRTENEIEAKKLLQDLLDASKSFQKKDTRHFLKTQDVTYCSFSTPEFTVPRSEAQRDAAQRFKRLGITKEVMSGKRVLDLGSNCGAMLLQATNLAIASGLGIEYDADKVDISNRIADLSHLTAVHFEQGDIDELQADKLGKFDIVFAFAIEAHVKDCGKLLKLLTDITQETLYFEGNAHCDIVMISDELKRLGFSKTTYLGVCNDDVRPENNVRPMLKAEK